MSSLESEYNKHEHELLKQQLSRLGLGNKSTSYVKVSSYEYGKSIIQSKKGKLLKALIIDKNNGNNILKFIDTLNTYQKINYKDSYNHRILRAQGDIKRIEMCKYEGVMEIFDKVANVYR